MSHDPGPTDPATAWEWLWRLLHRAPDALLTEIATAVEASARPGGPHLLDHYERGGMALQRAANEIERGAHRKPS